MKRRPSKAEQREELKQHIRDFLDLGGEIKEVARGASGWDALGAQKPTLFARQTETSERTPVNEVVAAIESRRAPHKPSKSPRRSPRKKAIYDDFGELIRWVWVD